MNTGIVFTEEYRRLNKEFVERFGDTLPCYELPAYETMEGLKEKIEICYKQGKDTLWEMYGLDKLMESGSII